MLQCSYVRPIVVSLFAITAALGFVVRANAQPVADHLKCYKVKDSQAKASYTADLGGLVAEPGCIIKVPGNLFCTETTKTNITPTPPGGTDNTGPAGGVGVMFVFVVSVQKRRSCARLKSSHRAPPRPLRRPRRRRQARRPRCLLGRSALRARVTSSAASTRQPFLRASLSPRANAARSSAPSTRSVPVRRPAALVATVLALCEQKPRRHS